MEPIRVYFNYKVVEDAWGGANSFLRSLLHCFNAMSTIKVVIDERDDYDIFFLNQLSHGPGRKWWMPKFIGPAAVARLKKHGFRTWIEGTSRFLLATNVKTHGKIIVCRVVNLHKNFYGRMTDADRKTLDVLQLTDFDIFQSKYIHGVFCQAGYVKDSFSIIYNGVDQKVFNTDGKAWWNGADNLKIYSCSFGTGKRKRFDIIAHLSEQNGVECCHIGNWPKDTDPKHVKLLGNMSQQEISSHYRHRGHVLIHPAEREVCPNVVIEALSCGLPVLYSSEGGTREVVGECGVVIGDDPSAAVDQIRSGYKEYVERIKQAWSTYSVEFAAARYVQVFKQVVCR